MTNSKRKRAGLDALVKSYLELYEGLMLPIIKVDGIGDAHRIIAFARKVLLPWFESSRSLELGADT